MVLKNLWNYRKENMKAIADELNLTAGEGG